MSKLFNRSRSLFLILMLMLFTVGAVVAQDAETEIDEAATNVAETIDEANTQADEAIATADATAEEAVESAEAAAPAASGGGMITGLRHTHAGLRWIIVLIAVIAIVKFVLGLAQDKPYDKLSANLLLAFAIVMTVQFVVGVIFLVMMGSQIGNFGVQHWWIHAVIMLIAVGLAHMGRRFVRSQATNQGKYRNSLILLVVILALVVVGVAVLPQGWRMFPV